VNFEYDVFLSHASEDKLAIAIPLYDALTKVGVRVWFDQAALSLGDSLRQRIDDGLRRARYGIVILSPSFLSKHWPVAELNGLFAREAASGKKAILPVWHQLTSVELARISPLLADRVAARTSEGIPTLVAQIVGALRD
jgi:hypothetical protein